MKARVTVKPNGTINGHEWPEVGDTIDLPDVVVEGMADWLEPVKPEKKVEKPKAEKPKVETRPASGKGVETRVSPVAD